MDPITCVNCGEEVTGTVKCSGCESPMCAECKEEDEYCIACQEAD